MDTRLYDAVGTLVNDPAEDRGVPFSRPSTVPGREPRWLKRLRGGAGEHPSLVSGREIQIRSLGHDPRRVDGRMTHEIVPLDVLEADSLGNPGDPIEIARVAPQICVVDEAAEVTLEVAD